MPDSQFQYTSYQNQFQNNYDERENIICWYKIKSLLYYRVF